MFYSAKYILFESFNASMMENTAQFKNKVNEVSLLIVGRYTKILTSMFLDFGGKEVTLLLVEETSPNWLGFGVKDEMGKESVFTFWRYISHININKNWMVHLFKSTARTLLTRQYKIIGYKRSSVHLVTIVKTFFYKTSVWSWSVTFRYLERVLRSLGCI